ncbi:uncharacterized protein LOC119289250 [Triticum dicoccoides]|uniref:uncharacterized protein LOC119289250 n=1 Tax=Triticum dicoccoides TaxID=85692 RepID=UPI00188EAE2E|nr:uncharacterized protein LOC119289250 [Triticum dicoccoides]
MGAGIGVSRIWTFYRICGGTKPVPADTTVCREQSPPPPPPTSPPPPPPSQGPPATTDDSAMTKYMDKITHTLTESMVSSYAMGGLLVVSVGTGIAVWVWKQYSDKHREPGQHPHGEVEMPPLHAGLRGDAASIIGTAAARLRRSVTSAPSLLRVRAPHPSLLRVRAPHPSRLRAPHQSLFPLVPLAQQLDLT